MAKIRHLENRQIAVSQRTRNSPVDEVGERYCLNHAIVVKHYHRYTPFFSVGSPTSSANRHSFGASYFFSTTAPHKYSYFLTDQFLVPNYLWHF